ncbi:alpha/beta hydrolase [Aeromicrobium sp. Root495]|uniref:alpha/beta fold hydrolase n=1 Tax=Aeromicrobium sp. Root495 TaxID=1736550 RepID=UPI0006F6A4A7|nr:alpha/beta hydrolase [Aeromicrobium sp. Root495]KQY55361.1 alpha/beta hydrolase [Aeromicrobium sp. Root495]RYJ07292.1 MAG: alpha/beta hydrolase [Actinomycetales bacterium]
MPFITTTDGTEIYYTEQGTGQPVLFSHGWPLSSDAWQYELKLLADAGYRAIAHDRRGHGRSSKTYTGNDMDTYAKDLAELVEALDLRDLVVVGHSTGGGEVVRYAAQHAAGRVVKVVTIGAVPPIMVKSETNPEGTPIDAFNGIREGVLKDRSQFYQDLSEAFFGANREGATVSQGAKDDFWRQGMLVNLAAAYDCVKAFSETDFTEDLKALDVPILIAHGDDDQIVPIEAAANKTIDLVKDGRLVTYPGAPHGIYGTYQQELGAEILAFLGQ